MCGIAGIIAYKRGVTVDRDELIGIRDFMSHRGPDGSGLWISDDRRVGLAHRRLSIIDLSDAAAQPMWNAERTLCITFNGEIYNYQSLQSQLEQKGHRFRSTSDTEVLLELYAEYEAGMVHHLRGMYAFAIWDAERRTLFAARDPFGIKPFYYATDGSSLWFASQVKALLTSKRIDRAPDAAGRVGYFIWGSVPEPFTSFRAIRALPAGHTLRLTEDGRIEVREYWSVNRVLRDAEAQTTGESSEAHLLDSALRDTVEHHLVADVPVGVFLSSGIDSSTIAALVSERHADVRTVTLQFEEYAGTAQDEAPLAAKVAQAYRTSHQTVTVARSDFEKEAEHLLQAMDQPSIDGVNTFFVSYAARRAGLKVALSGTGGDELFGGYDTFHQIPAAVRFLSPLARVPALGRLARVATVPFITRISSAKYASLFEFGGTYAGAYLLGRGLFMPWELPQLLEPEFAREGWEQLQMVERLEQTIAGIRSPRLRVSALELCFYMRQQLLRDADWAGMGHSLEIRVPFVDRFFFEAIAPLLAATGAPGKRDVGASPKPPLPPELLERGKTGFGIPVREWIAATRPELQNDRGLRGWAKYLYSRVQREL